MAKKKTDFKSCSFISEFGRCSQAPGLGQGLCQFHRLWAMRAPRRPDAFYHRKVILGLLTPSLDLLSEEEARALMSGRVHGDGRRLDAWVLPFDQIDESGWVD